MTICYWSNWFSLATNAQTEFAAHHEMCECFSLFLYTLVEGKPSRINHNMRRMYVEMYNK